MVGAVGFRRVQELDDEYLIVWQGFSGKQGKPWDYTTERGLREFLLERARARGSEAFGCVLKGS